MTVAQDTILVTGHEGNDDDKKTSRNRWLRRAGLAAGAVILVVLLLGVFRDFLPIHDSISQDNGEEQALRTSSIALQGDTSTATDAFNVSSASAVDQVVAASNGDPENEVSGHSEVIDTDAAATSGVTLNDTESATDAQSVSAVAGARGVELHDVPGGESTASLPTGTRLPVSGQTDDGS